MSFWRYKKSLPVPKRIKRQLGLLETTTLLPFILWICIIANGGSIPFSIWYVIVPCAAIYIPMLILVRRTLYRVRQIELMACPNCAAQYTSEGHQECKNCQFKFEATEARRLWRAAILRYDNRGRKPRIPAIRFRMLNIAAFAGIALFMCMIPVGIFSTNWVPGNNIISPAWFLLYITAALGFQFLSLLLYILVYQRTKSILARAHENDFLLCDSCLYPLHGLEESNSCPECGRPSNIRDIKRRWYECWASRKNLDRAITMEIPLIIRDDAKA